MSVAKLQGLGLVRLSGLLALALLAAACTPKPKPPPGVTPRRVRSGSRRSRRGVERISTAADEIADRPHGPRVAGGAGRCPRGLRQQIRSEGVLLRPRAALPRPAPTPGSYNCRLIKLGKATPKAPALEKFKPFFCYVEVEGDLLTIVKQTGSQRPAGRLWEDDEATRLVFLGSLALGGEDQPLAYGDNPKRDMAGVLERIGPFRWRLVIPWPQSTSKLDVFELTPVALQPQA